MRLIICKSAFLLLFLSMQQEWKFINGSNQRYSISSFGNVKSNGFNDSLGRFKPAKNLIPQNNGNGYFFVLLGRGNQKYIHRLVAEHFLNSVNLNLHVNHKDGNKQNNHFSNLEWVSRSQNDTHKKRNLEWHRYPIIDIETGIFYANAKEVFEVFGHTKNIGYGQWKSIIANSRRIGQYKRFLRL